MKSNQAGKFRTVKMLVALIPLATLLLAFQNCSEGYVAESSNSNSSISAPPTISFAASNPVSGTSTLTWSAADATTCEASGAWSGSKDIAGSVVVSPSATSIYTLTCENSEGSVNQSVTVNIALPIPTVTISANPSSITSGNSSVLTWSSINATSCAASGAWTGAKTTSGTLTVSPTATSVYTLACTGAGGTASQQATINVSAAIPLPTITLTANPSSIVAGASSTLSWSSTNAATCVGSGAWTGAKTLTGTMAVTPTATSTYTLSCTNSAAGTSSQSVTITVTKPAPTVTLMANPTSITAGGTSTLMWTSTNATSCTASGAWTGAKTVSGTLAVMPTVTSTYTLACTGSSTVTQSVTINVTPATTTGTDPTAASAAKAGSLTVKTYNTGITTTSDYTVSNVFYPSNATAASPGIVFIPGLNSNNEPVYLKEYVTIGGKQVLEVDCYQMGTLLASNGFIVMFINPKDGGIAPPARAPILLKAIEVLAKENTRAGSPIFGLLDVNNMAVMGHSYGGAGALMAGNLNSNARVKAAVGLSPITTAGNSFPNTKAATLIIGGVGDPYGTPFQAEYAGVPSTVPHLLAYFKKSTEFESMHAVGLVPLSTHTTDPTVARLTHSFLEVYLKGDMRYKQFLVNDATTMQAFGYVP